MEETAGENVVVRNAQGLHLRPATQFAKLALSTGCRVRVRADGADANGASVLELAMLGVTQGTELRIEAEGPGAADAVRRRTELVASGFSE
jgi:phosphotransferase system HPr (HPr) family protein